MQQHPVPQNITGFEFKLVGFLTLKQFGFLAAAGILSFILFLSGLGIFKWLFIFPIVLLGLASAFMPVNGIPFDKWVFLFFKMITSPSKRVWRKEPKELSFLAPQFSRYLRRPIAHTQPVSVSRANLEAFLSKVRAKKQNRLDNLEKTKLNMLNFDVQDKFSVVTTIPVINPLASPVTQPIPPIFQTTSQPSNQGRLMQAEIKEKIKENVESIKQSFSGLAEPIKERR